VPLRRILHRQFRFVLCQLPLQSRNLGLQRCTLIGSSYLHGRKRH
jgi:hypothetical protein